MLHASLAQINEALLVQVCKEKWPETTTLDFKAILPKGTEHDRDEFRKDVCAMANTDGGDIVFGIGEKAGKANAVVPVCDQAFDAAKRSLLQVLESHVEPRIEGLRFHEVAIPTGGYVLVLRVPASYVGPHRCGAPCAERFVVRSDSKTVDLTYHQLRDAFGRGSTLLEAAGQFRDKRIAKVRGGATPIVFSAGAKLAVHVIPLCGLAGRAHVDIRALQDDPRILMRQEHFMNWRRWPSLDGVVMYPTEEDADQYQLIFRTAALEVVHIVSEVRGQEKAAVDAGLVGLLLHSTLTTYAAAAASFGVSGPALISLALCHAGGMKMLMPGMYVSYAKRPAADDLLLLPDVVIDDISSSTLDVAAEMRPLMDVLYQCFGQHSCNLYDATGRWTGQT